MKKILLFIALLPALLISGCSKDDDERPRSELRANINGTDYHFDTFAVVEHPYPAEGYTDVEITASIASDPSRKITFIVTKSILGTNATWYFTYFLNLMPYQKVEDEFMIDITQNTDRRVRGIFAGNVLDEENGEVLEINNGTFDVQY